MNVETCGPPVTKMMSPDRNIMEVYGDSTKALHPIESLQLFVRRFTRDASPLLLESLQAVDGGWSGTLIRLADDAVGIFQLMVTDTGAILEIEHMDAFRVRQISNGPYVAGMNCDQLLAFIDCILQLDFEVTRIFGGPLTFTVDVACTLPAYGDVTLRATSQGNLDDLLATGPFKAESPAVVR